MKNKGMEIEIETEENEGPDEYEIKDWAETVMKAQEIKEDPEKMSLVQAHLEKKKSSIDSVVGAPKIKSMKQLKGIANKA